MTPSAEGEETLGQDRAGHLQNEAVDREQDPADHAAQADVDGRTAMERRNVRREAGARLAFVLGLSA
ncbi:hypothetical protein B5K08_24870 [Rhizobium leguminosarum bv. trifolii]|uniref:Uncharacterized protein n=2 Tax=Rhizobium TaxID=379 RepID=A0A3E1B6S1_RHILT|nr:MULTISPECIES: hypothetical protein [Rhizobium]KPH05173.1 hypothetical protein AOG23_29325 [Rhizobium acidisoli]QAS81111.1 hypothetical protein CO657_24350 [Rhizobium acidisoli]RFB86510.1 hypothetical protein B5K08_24870 [Rhizobium leguminosarum bv. trifolii]RFB86770.1 hypothetical protein B5K10_24860 [Rhizobium leguminosarum bv. trifolii]